MQPGSQSTPQKAPRTPKAKSARPQKVASHQKQNLQEGQGTPGRHRKQHGRNASGTHQYDGAVSDSPYHGPSENMTPAAQAAYAGPTFHASPAASSLPIPKFLSKSSTDVPTSRLQARMDAGESDQNELHTQTEEDGESDAPPANREDSPLDFFFRAQRAEKQRNSSPLATGLGPRNNSQTPSSIHRSAQYSGGSARMPASSSKAMFMMEVDGTAEGPESDGPMSSVSFHERLRQASPNTRALGRIKSPDEERLAKSEELKRLLSMKPAATGSALPQHPSQDVSRDPRLHPSVHAPTMQLGQHESQHEGWSKKQASAASGSWGGFNFEEALRASARKPPPTAPAVARETPQPSPQPVSQAKPIAPSANIQQMEDNLRKMLKLG